MHKVGHIALSFKGAKGGDFVIYISNIEKQYGDKLLFKGLNLEIYDGERVGIVGANGTGKSTLLKIIAGEEYPNSGSVRVDGKIGYLKQITEYSSADFLKLAQEPDFIKEFMEIKSRLHVSGDIDFSEERLHNLSGGEKTKLMLAEILCKRPEILLLDEPTNHMDLAGVDWLIDALELYEGTVLVVSHDRYFLNKCVHRIVELENGKVKEFDGAYDDYHFQKQQEYQSLVKRYENQQSLERKIDKQIDVLNSWASKGEREARRQGGMMSDSKIMGADITAKVRASKLASRAQAKISRLEHLKDDFIEKPYAEGEVHYRLESEPFKGKILVRAENICKKYGSKVLFKPSNFTIGAGEKIALVGENGSGKTTLIKMILGLEPYDGEIYVSPAVKIAYLSQDVFDLDENLTIMQKACQFDKQYRTLFLSNLVNMNMSRQSFDRKISTLSLGERMRVKMCELVLSDYNFLIMDEPTNHLDLNNKIFLEKILKDYKGCLLIVSHDRTLTKNVCNAILTIENSEIKRKE